MAAQTGSQAITSTAQLVSIPDAIGGVVGGTALCQPDELKVYNNSGAAIAAGALQLWNYDTHDMILFDAALANGSYLRLNCKTLVAHTSPDDAVWTVTGAVRGSPRWIPFRAGAVARVVVVGVGTGTLSWSYRGVYL